MQEGFDNAIVHLFLNLDPDATKIETSDFYKSLCSRTGNCNGFGKNGAKEFIALWGINYFFETVLAHMEGDIKAFLELIVTDLTNFMLSVVRGDIDPLQFSNEIDSYFKRFPIISNKTWDQCYHIVDKRFPWVEHQDYAAGWYIA